MQLNDPRRLGYDRYEGCKTMLRSMSHLWKVLATLVLGGCASVPEGLRPVADFQANRYLGTWYEIARLDHSFERGLSKVTADYSQRGDGSIQVVNRGYDARRGKWREARAVARFVGRADVASLKVTFFWPFSGAYHVIALDRDGYNYAMVTSSSRSYLWILARQQHLDAAVRNDLLAKAKEWGFRQEDLIFVEH
jgi:apolipoprotein D and lipocalin family protein